MRRKKPLVRKIPMIRKKRLRPFSQKRSAWLAAYRRAKKAYLEAHPIELGELKCWATGKVIGPGDAWSYHHPFGRGTREKILIFHPVLQEAHDKIHANPSWARSQGLLFF